MLKECFSHFKTAAILTTHSMNEAEMLATKIGILVSRLFLIKGKWTICDNKQSLIVKIKIR